MRRLGGFGDSERGVAMVEFAFVAPLLILFYVGMAELCQGLMAERKASHVASAVADLVAQSDEITAAGVGGIIDIADVILEPFPGGVNLDIRVTSGLMDANRVTKVAWSEHRNWSARAPGSVLTIPKVPDGNGGMRDLLAPGEGVIVTEVNYAFETPFSDIFTKAQELALGSASIHEGGYTFDAVYHLRPRRTDQVVCADC